MTAPSRIPFPGDGGQGTSAALNQPQGIAVVVKADETVQGGYRKLLYISDTGNNVIRRVLLDGFAVGTQPPTTAPTTGSPTKTPSQRPTNVRRRL